MKGFQTNRTTSGHVIIVIVVIVIVVIVFVVIVIVIVVVDGLFDGSCDGP